MSEEEVVDVSEVKEINTKDNKICDSISAQFEIHHNHCGDQVPTSVQCRYIHNLESNEQPYRRRHTIKGFVELDLGWINPASTGLVIIENVSGQGEYINPTEEEQALQKKRVLLLCGVDDLANPYAIISPGKCQPFEFGGRKFVIGAMDESAPVTMIITVIPK